MSRFLRMKKKLASVSGTGNGEKILQNHMGFSGGRILRVIESTMEKQKGSKAAKETRKSLLRFVIKADTLLQEGQFNLSMWTDVESSILDLCKIVAAATASSIALRRRYSSIKEVPTTPTTTTRKKIGLSISTGDDNEATKTDSVPTTPTQSQEQEHGGLKRTMSRRAPKTNGPPGMASFGDDSVTGPSSNNTESLLPPSAPETPVGGPPPPGMFDDNNSGGGPPGMNSESKTNGNPGAPPSGLASRGRPPLPSRPTPKDYTQDDIQSICMSIASLVPILMNLLAKEDKMSTKNRTTLSQLISSISTPDFLEIFLTDKRNKDERSTAYAVSSAYADQLTTVCNKRNEKLRVAAFAGDMETIHTCVENGADVNSRREDCTTPLWFAAAKGQEAAVRYLIKNGADSSIADKDGALPVMLAAQEGHLDIVRLLLEPDLHKNVPEASTLATLVFIAARKGHADLLDHILKAHVAELSVATPGGNAKAAPIELALTLAIQQGHIQLVHVLLKHGCNIASAIEHGITPVLVSASHSGSVEMTQLLIDEAGADVNAVDKAGISPLAEAAECGHTSVGQILMDNGAKVDTAGTHDGMTALLLASQAGYTDFVDMVLKGGANVSARDHIGSTALMLAAQQGHDAMVNKLVKAGSPVNAKDDDGTSALFFAAQEGYPAVVKILLSNGANPNLTDDHGAGPLLVAVQEGHLTIVRDLIEHEDFTADGEISKTDINASREDGITPVFTAAWLGRIHVLRLLLEFGADPNPSNNTEFDDTPLCGAINRGHSDAVRALIAAKAIVNASPRKSDGMTPFTLAVSKCNEEDSADARTVLELLIEAGANAEGTSSGAGKSGAKAMPARRAAPSMSRKASQAEFKSMKIAKDRAKERTVVAKEEMVLAKIEGKYKPIKERQSEWKHCSVEYFYKLPRLFFVSCSSILKQLKTSHFF